MSSHYTRGQWAAFDAVLHYLNTLEVQEVDKGRIYKAVAAMRPESPPDIVCPLCGASGHVK